MIYTNLSRCILKVLSDERLSPSLKQSLRKTFAKGFSGITKVGITQASNGERVNDLLTNINKAKNPTEAKQSAKELAEYLANSLLDESLDVLQNRYYLEFLDILQTSLQNIIPEIEDIFEGLDITTELKDSITKQYQQLVEQRKVEAKV
jgi:hypothetical protein